MQVMWGLYFLVLGIVWIIIGLSSTGEDRNTWITIGIGFIASSPIWAMVDHR